MVIKQSIKSWTSYQEQVEILKIQPKAASKSKFMEFLREGNTELTVIVHERTKGIKDKTVNPNLDALRELGANESQTLVG